MSNSYVKITNCFLLRITANFFPNTVNNKELNVMYCSLNIIRVIRPRTMRWTGHRASMEESCVPVLVGKPEGNRPLGRSRHRWENNIKQDLQQVWRGKWTGLIWLRIGTCGRLLWMQQRTFGFPKMHRISWLVGNRLDSQEWLCSVELVN